MVKISVIIPVYNVEKYLRQCVDSVLAQTVTDLECILVDDGSTDSSPSICDEYAVRDSRVKVIHKTNGRAASARNAGLRIAQGEFVSLVDSDDWIAPEMYEKLLETGADVSQCDFVRFSEDAEYPFTQPNVNGGFYNKEQMRRDIYPYLVMDGLEFPITISNCVLLIRRSILQKNHLQYREDIRISEDAPFGSEVLYCANTYAYLKEQYMYHYRITPGSASKSYKSWWWDSYLKINEETEDFFSKCPDYDFTQQIKSNMFYLSRAAIYYCLYDTTLSPAEQNATIREIMNHPRVIRMMKGFKIGNVPLSFKMVYWSIRYRSVALRRLTEVISRLRRRIA